MIITVMTGSLVMVPTTPGDTQRLEIAASVAALPALPQPDGNRYHPRSLTELWLRKKSTNTRRAYFADLARWLAYCDQQHLDPMSARRADIDDWADRLGEAPRTVNRRLSAVSSWYRYLLANDAGERNPVDGIERPVFSRDQSPLVGLTQADAVAVLAEAQARVDHTGSEAALRDLALISLLIDTGLRIGGALGADIDSVGHADGHRVVNYRNKGGKRLRAVVPPHSAVKLDAYLKRRADREGVAAADLTGPLFVTTPYRQRSGGRRLVQRDAWNLIRGLARAAGVPNWDKIVPHSTRRTFNTIAKSRGVSLDRRQDALGHADPRTTRLYDDDKDRLDGSPAYEVAAALAAFEGPQPAETG